VIGIIAILAAIVIVAVNPARQFAQARNAQRESNVQAIVNAVHQNMVDNDGSWTGPTIPDSPATITSATGGLDICDDIVPTYIAEMPVDPAEGSYTDCTDYNAAYTIESATANRITVSAPNAELERVISVTQ
jgi:type IV pilus assembly protein PilA